LPTFTLRVFPTALGALSTVAQAVEHYEIARYGTLKTWATELGLDQAKLLLEATLAEEKRLSRPSRSLRKTKSTSTLRLPQAAAATDSVVLDPSTKPRRTKSREASFLPRERKRRIPIRNETIE
jgi:hypothetical protein